MNTAYAESLHKHALSVAQRSKQLEQSQFQVHGHKPRIAISHHSTKVMSKTPKLQGTLPSLGVTFHLTLQMAWNLIRDYCQTFCKCRIQRIGPTFTLLLSSPPPWCTIFSDFRTGGAQIWKRFTILEYIVATFLKDLGNFNKCKKVNMNNQLVALG